MMKFLVFNQVRLFLTKLRRISSRKTITLKTPPHNPNPIDQNLEFWKFLLKIYCIYSIKKGNNALSFLT